MPNILKYPKYNDKESQNSGKENIEKPEKKRQQILIKTIDIIQNSLSSTIFGDSIKQKLDFIKKSDIYKNKKTYEQIINGLNNISNLTDEEKKLRIVIDLYNIVYDYNQEKTQVKKDTYEKISNILPENTDNIFINQAKQYLSFIDISKVGGDAKKKIEKIKNDINNISNKVKQASHILELAIEAKNIYDEYIGGEKSSKDKKGKVNANGNSEANNSGSFGEAIEGAKTFIPFFGSNELKEIKSIDIDGSVDSIAEFKKRLKNLIVYIKTTKTYKNLSEKQQEALINNIKSLGDNLQSAEKIGFKNIEDLFNGYAEQIDKQKDGEINLDLGNVIVIFKSKKEAFEYIKILKEKSEKEFQSNIQNIVEFLGIGIGSILEAGGNIITKPFTWPIHDAKDLLKDFKDDVNGFKWSRDSLMFIISSFMAINYVETLVRRGIIDVAAKMGKKVPILKEKVLDENGNVVEEEIEVKDKKGNTKTIKKPKKRAKTIVIPDFSKVSKNQILTGNQADLYNEYLQRIFIMDRLQEMLDEKIGTEKELFRQQLEKVKSLLNVNSKSFYLDAYALKKGLWNPRKYWWALRNGKIPFTIHFGFLPFFAQDLSQKAQTEFNVERNELIKEYNKGIKTVFKNGDITEQDGKIDIDVNTQKENYSETIETIFSHIDNNNSITKEEKIKRKKRIKEFLGTLATRPRTKEYIKNKLYNIAVNGEMAIDEIKATIEEKLKEYIPEENKLETKKFSEWLSDLPKEVRQEFYSKFSEIYGSKAPAILTKGQASLIKLIYFVDNGMLEVNEQELKTLIEECLSGKIEFNRLYDTKLKKLKFIKDLGVQGFLKILRGDKIEFTKMKKYSSKVSENDWNNFIQEGEQISKSIEKTKRLFKSELYMNLRHIINLDSRSFPDDKEKFFEELFEELEKKIESGELKYTEKQLLEEFLKVYNGFVTNNYIEKVLENKGEDFLKRENVIDFIQKYNSNRWMGTKEDFREVIIKLEDGEIIEERYIEFGENIEKEIKKKGKRLQKLDFKNPDYGLPLKEGIIDTEELKNTEFKLAEFYHKIKGTNFEKSKFNIFISNLEKGIDYRIKEYYRLLSKSLGIQTPITQIRERGDYLKSIGEDINKYFIEVKDIVDDKSKSIEEKKRKILELENRLGKPLESLTEIEKEVLKKGLVIIDSLLKSYREFRSDKTKIEEQEKQKRKEERKERNKKLVQLDEQIKQLETVLDRKNQKELKDAYQELYRVSLELGSTEDYVEKIMNKLIELKLKKLQLINPEQLQVYLEEVSFEESLKEYQIKKEELKSQTREYLEKRIKTIRKGSEIEVKRAQKELIEKIKEIKKIR